MKGYETMIIVMNSDLKAITRGYPLENEYELNIASIMINAIKTINSYEIFQNYELECIKFEPDEKNIIVNFRK